MSRRNWLHCYWEIALLAAVARTVLVTLVEAVHVNLDAVTDYFSGNVAAYGSQQSLRRRHSELSHCPALNAHGVVMVSPFAEAVDGSAAHRVKLAEHARFQEEL